MCFIKNTCLNSRSLFDTPTFDATPIPSEPVHEISSAKDLTVMGQNPWIPSYSLSSSKVLLRLIYNSVVANSQKMVKL